METNKNAAHLGGAGEGMRSAGGTASNHTTIDAIEQFQRAIADAGIPSPETIEADGALHRFSTNGRRGDDAGWYILYPDDIPVGAFGCWREGINQTWYANIGRKLTDEETRAHRAKVAAMRKAREAEERRGHKEAVAKAEAIWNAATPATGEHPYLQRKDIAPHGTRVADDGRLLVPMRDADSRLWNLERIAKDGTKRGLYQGRRTGCFYIIGTIKQGPVLCICEGFATGASIHEATGYPVAVAFNAQNLKPVAKALRRKWPDLPIILCADNDLDTEARGKGNPGLTTAKEATKAVGGLVALPGFGPERPEGATDFNDLHRAQGLEAVKQQVESVIAAAGIDRSEPGDMQTPATFPPPEEARPCFAVIDDWVEVAGRKYKSGVHWCEVKKANSDETPIISETWVCSLLYVDALTCDQQEGNFGRLLRFKNTLGKWCTWAMPMDLLAGDCRELRETLLRSGVTMDPSTRRLLPLYIQRRVPNRRMLCTQQGWAKPPGMAACPTFPCFRWCNSPTRIEYRKIHVGCGERLLAAPGTPVLTAQQIRGAAGSEPYLYGISTWSELSLWLHPSGPPLSRVLGGLLVKKET